MSHPAWVCGLKLRVTSNPVIPGIVTPCVGVWIETVPLTGKFELILVTPCVGVWIETGRKAIYPEYITSHPAWVCGLKLYNLIERTAIAESHPAWVCGLKPGVPGKDGKTYCHTLRGCVD